VTSTAVDIVIIINVTINNNSKSFNV
jgi:hypothetical protein